MNEYGITVDRRHLLLLSDVMTFKGMVGIICICYTIYVCVYTILYAITVTIVCIYDILHGYMLYMCR